jgi:Kef-type K+ transport system membrane component KefB
VAGGVVGTLAGLESGTREHWETSVRSALIMATVGFAVIAIIGVIRWRQSTRPAVAAGTPSPAAA